MGVHDRHGVGGAALLDGRFVKGGAALKVALPKKGVATGWMERLYLGKWRGPVWWGWRKAAGRGVCDWT